MSKQKVKQVIDTKVSDFCTDKFEEIELSKEGSLTETYKYMSLENVKKLLEMCFDETYNETIKNVKLESKS